MSATGGTQSTNGSYTVHTFTSDGTFEVTEQIDANFLIVAGGGAGGNSDGYAAGGGGAGGVIETNSILSPGTYTISVGNGGVLPANPTAPANGENSSAFGFTAIGGGGGGVLNTTLEPDEGVAPNTGGSGGGGGAQIETRTFDGALGTAGQGNPGGNGRFSNTDTAEQSGGGGGGASTAGGNGTISLAGDGGDGIQSFISGTGTYYAGGGGGGRRNTVVGVGDGGLGGGGNGDGSNALPNTGGGGGAGSGSGGSGIVIVSYATPSPDFATIVSAFTATANFELPGVVAGTPNNNQEVLPMAAYSVGIKPYVDLAGPSYEDLILADSPHIYTHDGSSTPSDLGSTTDYSFDILNASHSLPSTGLLSGVNEGLSWGTSTRGTHFSLSNSNVNTNWAYLASVNHTWTFEMWFKPTVDAGPGSNIMLFAYSDGLTGGRGNSPLQQVKLNPAEDTNRDLALFLTINETGGIFLPANANVVYGSWNHLVVTGEYVPGDPAGVRFRIYNNNAKVTDYTHTFAPVTFNWTNNPTVVWDVGNTDRVISSNLDSQLIYLDELALYDVTLSDQDVADRWNAVQAVAPASATVNATPITATGDVPDSTIVTIIANSVYVTTYVTVSAVFPEPTLSNASTTTFNAEPMTAFNAELPDNVQIFSEAELILVVEEFTATAIFAEPILAQRAATASALLRAPFIDIQDNYFSEVTQYNPYFYIFDGQPLPTNVGDWNVTGWDNEYFDFNVPSEEELAAVGNGLSWEANSESITLNQPTIMPQIPNYKAEVEALYATRAVTVEFWYWSIADGDEFTRQSESGALYNDGITQIAEVYDGFGIDALEQHVFITERYISAGVEEGAVNIFRTYIPPTPKKDAWNHVVIAYEPNIDPDKVRRYIYFNGAIIGNDLLTIAETAIEGEDPLLPDTGKISFDMNQSSFTGPQIGSAITIGGSQAIKLNDGVKVDEIAIYPVTLSNSQVLDHYSFIRSLTPDAEHNHKPYGVQAEIVQPSILPIVNFVYQASPVSALGAAGDAGVLPEVWVNVDAEPATATGNIVDPRIDYGVNFVDSGATAFGELTLAFVIDDAYSQYVNTNYAPYRYLSFDGQDPFDDEGSDIDYAVRDMSTDGTLVSVAEGINGRSIRTGGTNYTTDGVIMYESEYNDDWNTGADEYHASFWIRRSITDNSTTGLRVLWNLNGAFDNQHVVLYYWQDRLYIQFNNGSGTFLEQSTLWLGLFDYTDHHIGIAFDHTGINNWVYVFVDGNIAMNVDLGQYTGQTINSDTYLSPNLEANNFPRMSVGCLITPFGDTGLPVVPSNYSAVIDEIHFSKQLLDLAGAQGLYAAMPFKEFAILSAEEFTATALSVNPVVSGSVNMLADPATASGIINDAAALPIQSPIVEAAPLVANATFPLAERSDSRVVSGGSMLATGRMGLTKVIRIVDVGAMQATAEILRENLLVNNNNVNTQESVWLSYVKAQPKPIYKITNEVA